MSNADGAISESPADVLERWECCGGTWSIRSLSVDGAEIDLCTCAGELVDVLRSSEAGFLALLEAGLRADPPRPTAASARAGVDGLIAHAPLSG